MHFKVLVVGTQLGWGEVDELLFPFFCYFDIYPIEQRQEDPRFVFGKVVLEEEFNEFKLANKLRNPNSENEYEKETAEDWQNVTLTLYMKKIKVGDFGVILKVRELNGTGT